MVCLLTIFGKTQHAGLTWTDLTLIEKRVRESKAAALEPEKDAADAANPNDAIMNMMKKMYNSGDAEMKKIIGKAWTEGEEKRRLGLQ